MKKIPFGKTGFQVSQLGFGAAPIGFLQTDHTQCSLILKTLLDAGVNVIDTAAAYAGSEEVIGKSISHRRSEFVIISKCGNVPSDVPGEELWSPALIASSIDRSLKRLNTDHIDIMLLHTCDLPTLKKGEALGALVKARQAGKIRFAGYSGDNQSAAYAAALPDIAAIETSINIVDQANIDSVLPVALQHNVGVIVKRPIANACWRKPAEQAGLYAEYSRNYHERLLRMNITPDQLGFHGPVETAWPELALRFTLSQPGVSVAIIGTTSPTRAAANIATVKHGPLPPGTVEKLRKAFFAAQHEAGEIWAGST